MLILILKISLAPQGRPDKAQANGR
jgi:hypothetical protein